MALNSKKKLAFWLITILFPFFLLALIELGFRIAGYEKDKQDLFIEMPGKEEYLATNPAFVGRYFTNFLPQVVPAPFLKEKPDSTFRVFVFGGSSTAGFPYNFYGSFSSHLEQKLIMETLGLKIEVINLGMTAVNSYVIQDLSKRVLDYEPDAVVIYAGHNEYYGSFGVGSAQFGIGSQVWLKRLILKFKNLRLYQFIENSMKPEDENSENRTLMARIVNKSSIPLDGSVYESGVHQFERNMEDVLSLFSKKGIPIYIGTVASNLKDQAPLGEDESANESYLQGKVALRQGNIEEATRLFEEAKELDDTRFRAPSMINQVITELSDEYDATLIDVEAVAYDSSKSGIPDNSFFTDHLHPDWDANQLIGELFFDQIVDAQLSEFYTPNKLSKRPSLNQFEKVFSETPVFRLTSGYPFTKGLSPAQEYANFQAKLDSLYARSYVDSVAAHAWRHQRQVYLALVDVINHQFNRRDIVGLSDHYLSLANWQIFNNDLLKKGVDRSVQFREMDSNTALLLEIILNKERRQDPYFINSLSAIYLLNQDLDRAGYWLRESERLNPNTSELLYNYARYHVLAGDTLQARNYYDRYIQVTGQN